MPRPAESRRFPRSRLAEWYRREGRHELPWRQTRDTYAVLVSEVMLQQTQVSRVVPAYAAWLERWPTPAALAAASSADVIRAWAGMGYNRRALNLWRAAGAVVERFDGRVPVAVESLRGLPGVGPYTASAVVSFAGERRVAVRDTNISRVLARFSFGNAEARCVQPISLDAAADGVLPRTGARARDHNLALMDLGALVCGSRRAECALCPLATACAWKAAGFPVSRRARAPGVRFEDTARFARGRLIDALRTCPAADAARLAACLPPEHRPLLDAYLSGLERDGLVARAGDGRWRLPQGNSNIASPKL